MAGNLVPLVVLTIFLLTETTTGSEQHLTQKRQSIRAQGCIDAGFTHCCAYGACRVELPDGGQCHCDHYCVDNIYNRYLRRNCCSDNPCEGISFEKHQYFVSEDDGFVKVCANLYGRQGLTVAVRFNTGSGTAQVGRDFNGRNEVLQMTSGERKCWNVTILDDSISEARRRYYGRPDEEWFHISLWPIRASFRSTDTTVYIIDNDRDIPPYQVLFNKPYNLHSLPYYYRPLSCVGTRMYVAVEGDDPLEICVRISGSEGETVIAKVIAWDGTATASQDYIASNQTLTFTTPERKCIRIEIVDDSEVEGDEEFLVYLTLPTDTGSEILSWCGSVQITDNDDPTLEQTSLTVDEGDGSVQVCMHFGGEGLSITATATVDPSRTATRGSDYSFATQSFLLHSGERRCVSIEIVDDTIVEQHTESVRVQFRTRPSYGNAATYYNTIISIRDNDAPAFESGQYFVDEGAGTVQVCMHFGGVGLVDNVTLSTVDGSAKMRRDYSRTVQTFTVRSGERRCITIRILNDFIIESAVEYFHVQLQSTGYRQSYYHRLRHAIVYIQDNDGQYTDIVEPQEQTGSGCIAAGFTRCCAFGACRVDLPDGGHCYCDQECFTYAHHNCCYDNPCDVLGWERSNYYASEGDSVEVCLRSGQTQGIARAYSAHPTNYTLNGQHLDEWVRITPGGRKCWNITLQDDDIFQLLDRNTHEYFNLQIAFYSTSESSIRYYYTQLNIVEDERAPAGVSLVANEIDNSHTQSQFCAQRNYFAREGDRIGLCMQLLGQGGTLSTYLAVLDGTAMASLDYGNTTQSLQFRAGENCVDIETLEDSRFEEREQFYTYLAIATTTGAKILHSCHRIDIEDNEAPILEQSSFTVDEGDESAKVCMHFGGEALTTNATFTIQNGSALNGSDYIGATQTFVVDSGERRCITIEILDDSHVEREEYLYVQLTVESFSTRGYCIIYITDNDGLTLSLNASAYSVAENGGSVNVCVLGLRGTRSSSATATISTQDISAIGGRDYTIISQTRTLRSGSIECVSIPIIDDITQELTEVFRVTLITSDAVRLENNTARVEIMDDDYVDCNPPCANGICSIRGQCVCSAGWTGSICTIDINECLMGNGGCDQNCTNLPGSYTCSCTGGFMLDENQQMCNDINECQAGSHNCTAPAQCVNFEGGFRCSCNTGYMLSDITYANCEDIDECALANGGCAHICNNTDGSFSCMCDEGYGLDEDGQQCIDINECERGSHNCSADNPAPAKCVNLVGGFRCSCVDYLGYRLNKSTYASCEDIDECSEGISGCNQVCDNTVGSFNCSCRSGYQNSELDHRICIDVDECDGNNDCDHGCINKLGTYQCMCSQGYVLQDGRSCEPIRCPTLEAPQNGTITCTQQTTGGQCSFICNKGYTLLGTRFRVCFPSMRWSGRTAICRPRQCASLEPPDHGFVLLPCTREYATSCGIQCEYGYNREGPSEQFCSLYDGTDQLQWTEVPVCEESNVCQPDTCKHNGTCSPSGATTFTCDCDGTGFSGPTCNTGIFSTPVIPTLTVNVLSETLVLSAPAEKGLMVRADGGYYLEISPSEFQFTPTNRNATFVVKGTAPGFYVIQYALSGPDANNFMLPVGSPVFVAEPVGDGTNYFEELGIATGLLQQSCCKPSDISFQCPMSSLSNQITFKSACEWTSTPENTVSTGGVVFVANNNFSLPLSVAGIDVDRTVGHVELLQDRVDDCKPCKENMNNLADGQCYHYNFTTRDTQLFLQDSSLAYTYIENIRQFLFPSWFDIHIDQDLGPVSCAFTDHDYTTPLVKPEDISTLVGCQELDVDQSSETLYSVLRYGRTISALVDGEYMTYTEPRSVFSPGASDPICFAVNLCQGKSSPIHIDLSRPTQELLVSQFLGEYSVNRGWDITIHSVVLSKAAMTSHPISSLYWNGISFFQPELPRFDVIVNTESTIPFSSGHLQVNLNFIGKFYYLYQEKDGVLVGRMDLDINTTIAGESRRLHLTGNSTTKSTLNISGNTDCSQEESEDHKASGISTKLVHTQRPGQLFFSELLPFAEETTDCLVDVFVNLDPDLRVQGFSIHTGCPHVNLGRLTFTGMNHRLYFSGTGNFEQLCLQENMPEVADPSLLIYSSLKRDRLPLGNFLTLHQSDSSAALLLAFGRDDSTFVAKLDKVAVSLLDANFFTSVPIVNNNLQFTANATIFGRYEAYLIVSAPTNDFSWDFLPFSISAVMRNDTNGFYELLSASIDRQLRDAAINARRREFLANAARSSSQRNLQMFQTQLTERRMELGNDNTTYQDRLAEVSTANSALLEAQKAFDNASEELKQYEEEVNNLCMEQFCEDVCMSGRICAPSYIDSYTEETGRCPYTDFETRRVRIAPFFVSRRVWRWILVCRNVSDQYACNVECQFPPQGEVCFGRCVPVVVQVPVYHWGDIQVPVEKYRNCTVRVHNGTIPTTVCELNDCALRRPDNSCIAENGACRVARQVAFERLMQARQNIAEPFLMLSEARMNISLARSAASIAQIRLESSQQMFNQLLSAYQGAQLSCDLAEASYQKTISEVEIGLQIFAVLYEQRIPSVDVLRIVNVTFNITIAVESPSQFPILITYVKSRTGQVFEKMVDFDFSTQHQVELFNIIAQEMVSEAFQERQTWSASSHSRSKRQEVESVSSNQQRFEENCADLQNIILFLSEIATSLAQVNESLNNAEQVTEEQVQVISSQFQVGSLDDMNVVNFTVLESAFNVTANFENLGERVRDDAEVKAYIALLEEQLKAINERLQTLKDNAFQDWMSRVESLYSQSTSVSGYQCFNFGDCLLTAADRFEALLQNTPGTEAEALLAQLPLAREDLVDLALVTNLTVPEAISKINPILAIINEYNQNNYWCSSLPRIILHPPPEVNVSTDGTLILTCEADSDLTLTYQWKKNGNTIPDSNSNQLFLTNMQRLDSGNYSCHASNPVGTVSSISTSVLVYELPEFYLLPVSASVYESDENGAWFACNATAWPYPGWRWYFRPTEDSAWMPIDGEITNELLIPLPQRRHEGWYTCEAYNAHGSIRAEGVYLRILLFTVSQQAIPIQFQLMSSEEDCQVDGVCSNETVRENILQALFELVDHTTTVITGLEVVQNSECAYTCSFALVTENVTAEEIQLIEIANRAVPKRTGLQRSKLAIESAIQQGEFTVRCAPLTLRASVFSLTVQNLVYICPAGQQLSSNFLLCGTCEPGTFSIYTEQTRIFNGEAVTERFQVCRPCLIGSYEPRVGSSMCIPCPEFHTTLSTGMTSAAECMVDPLLLECTTDGSRTHVTIDCQSNRPPVTTMCSFDGGLEHQCDLPISVNLRTFTPGNHTLRIIITDTVALTAQDTIEYLLENDTRPSNFLPDVPQLRIQFISDSPRVTGNTVEADFILTRPAFSVTCQISRHRELNCSSGSVSFTDLDPGRYVLRVAATNSKEDRAIERRRFEINSDPSFCSTHLINGGVTVRGNTATVEFAGSGPAEMFSCRLDTEPAFACTSPVEVTELTAGEHSLKIVPQDCGKNRRPQNVKFTV